MDSKAHLNEIATLALHWILTLYLSATLKVTIQLEYFVALLVYTLLYY